MPHDVELGSESLTGVWQGRYTYGSGQGCAFVATLMEIGSFLSGTTHELNEAAGTGEELFAMVEGSRRGRIATFTKTYDGSAGWDHAVRYEGKLSGDGTEIEGRWSIGDADSGSFLMLRSGGKAATVARRAVERV